MALDRINDTLGLLAVCAVVLFSLPLNRSVEIPGGVLGVEGPVVVSESVVRAVVLSFALAVAMVLALLAALYLRSAQILRIAERVFRPLPERLARRLRRVLAELADGLHVLGSPRASAKSLGFSLLAWGCGVAAIAAVLHSFGLGFSWRTPFLMQAMIALFVIVPLAPGLVGQFHLAVLACLLMALPAVSLDEARAVALVMHLVAVVPIAVLGGASLALERLGLEDLVRVDARARATDAGA